MTALEAKRTADNFNQELFRRALEKTTKYFNKQIEENAYQGSYEFCIRSDNDDLIIAVGKREIFELFHNPDLQKELKKQFRTDGFFFIFRLSMPPIIPFFSRRESRKTGMAPHWRMAPW